MLRLYIIFVYIEAILRLLHKGELYSLEENFLTLVCLERKPQNIAKLVA